jgi:hypothetical protein
LLPFPLSPLALLEPLARAPSTFVVVDGDGWAVTVGAVGGAVVAVPALVTFVVIAVVGVGPVGAVVGT